MPYTRSGLFAGVLLSLGRALGETMAVTMLIGNTSAVAHTFKDAIFGPGNTMASVIANEFTEADHTVYFSALIELGLGAVFCNSGYQPDRQKDNHTDSLIINVWKQK